MWTPTRPSLAEQHCGHLPEPTGSSTSLVLRYWLSRLAVASRDNDAKIGVVGVVLALVLIALAL